MAMWKNDDEMFALMKEKLYTPVVGDILDQMGYKHQFLPASIRPLAAQVPTAPYILPGEEEDLSLIHISFPLPRSGRGARSAGRGQTGRPADSGSHGSYDNAGVAACPGCRCGSGAGGV